MAWSMHSRKRVVHKDGHAIELVSGTWRVPYEINPVIRRGTNSVETARLIREGLVFAARSEVHAKVEA